MKQCGTSRLMPTLKKYPNKRLSSLIKPAGYFNLKTKRLKAFLEFLFRDYGGSIKKMKKTDTQMLREKLLDVYGIGPETADSILLYALKKPVFVIDAYTRRILLRHKLIKEENGYDEIQELFYRYVEPDVKIYNEYHALFVKLGKDYCKKSKPLCCECPLKNGL